MHLTKQIHADSKKRRSSFLDALLFAAGDLRRYVSHFKRTTVSLFSSATRYSRNVILSVVYNVTPNFPLRLYASSSSIKQWDFFIMSVISGSLFIHLARFSRQFEHLGRSGSPGSSQSETLVASTSSYDYSAEPRPRALDVAVCSILGLKKPMVVTSHITSRCTRPAYTLRRSGSVPLLSSSFIKYSLVLNRGRVSLVVM